MTRSLGRTIADSLQLSLNYAERLQKGISADQFGRLAHAGERPVQSNHPAFVYGHLSLYGPRILEQLNVSGPSVPQAFEDVFSKDATCVDDPDGSVYPPMDEVISLFFEGYRAAHAALSEVADEVLQEPNPVGGRLTELFPTLGSMHNFYVGGHMMIHLGQLSAWRRFVGLGAA